MLRTRPSHDIVDFYDCKWNMSKVGPSADGLIDHAGGRIVVGVCAMEAKTSSKAMRSILDRLVATDHFAIFCWTDELLLKTPVCNWPLCDALVAFFSTGYPLDKAAQYAEMNRHRMFLVNEIAPQRWLLDRRLVLDMLLFNSVDVPKHVVISNDGVPSSPMNFNHPAVPPLVQEVGDNISVNGMTIRKPFVEKPIDGENHNIHIYYLSKEAGGRGGSKRLHRKVGNRSSIDHPDVHKTRHDGKASHVYEAFITTKVKSDKCTENIQRDLKVYTVGKRYAHAEARKSPEVDGRVDRHPDGREIRDVVELTEDEKRMASVIVRSFGQRVCGLDVLRSDSGTSYVCDVNGWSFVKGNTQYYDMCARKLTKMLLKHGARMSTGLRHCLLNNPPEYRLKGIVTVFRHADRTPKQKVKLKITDPDVLRLFSNPQKEVKLKSDTNQEELKELLHIIEMLLLRQEPSPDMFGSHDSPLRPPIKLSSSPCTRDQMSVPGVEGTRGRLELVRSVLEHLYEGTKIQLKPIRLSSDGMRVEKCLMVCKWGGTITDTGIVQARALGAHYRSFHIGRDAKAAGVDDAFYLANLSTHIYSNNERRVKNTAHHFASALTEGILDDVEVLDNGFTNKVLGDISDARADCDDMKIRLHDLLHHQEMDGPVREALMHCGIPKLETIARNDCHHSRLFAMLTDIYVYLRCVEYALNKRIRESVCCPSEVLLHGGETLPMMAQRWSRLASSFYNKKTQRFDTTKIPDVEDYIKFDALHNREVMRENVMIPLFDKAKALADFVVPREYGITSEDKLRIGKEIGSPLFSCILSNISDICSDEPDSPVHLYFTSESHVHPLVNVLLHSGKAEMNTPRYYREMNYLTQVMFKVYEDVSKEADSPDRYKIQLFLSSGAISDALAVAPEDDQVLPILPALCMHNGLSLEQLESVLHAE